MGEWKEEEWEETKGRWDEGGGNGRGEKGGLKEQVASLPSTFSSSFSHLKALPRIISLYLKKERIP